MYGKIADPIAESGVFESDDRVPPIKVIANPISIIRKDPINPRIARNVAQLLAVRR